MRTWRDTLSVETTLPKETKFGLERVARLFERQQQGGAYPGGQLAVRHSGRQILSFASGVGRGYRSGLPVKVSPDTPFPVFSAGKPLAAVAIALLEDRGLLDVGAPLSKTIPELRDPCKEAITTLDVLTHRSGLLMPDLVADHGAWSSREAVLAALARNVPAYPRGTLAYHPHEYGWILNEIVLRVDGRTLHAFFEEEVAVPLRLPALRFGLAGRDLGSLAYSYWLGAPKVMVAGYNVAADFEWMNSEEFFTANNPATSLVTDANSLAAFYDFLLNGGETPEGRRLISEAALRRYTTRTAYAWDRSLRTPIAVGRGFVVGTRLPSTFGWWNTAGCFGHAGAFSCLAFGDRGTGTSAAILTNGNRSLGDFTRRFLPLATEIRKACRHLATV